MKEEGEKILKLFFVKDGEDVLLAVEDNGPGMEQEEADKLVTYKASGYAILSYSYSKASGKCIN